MSLSGFVNLFRYNKAKYSFLFCLVFACAIFENFKLGQNVALSDVLYAIFGFLFFLKLFKFRTNNRALSLFLYPLLFFIIAFIDFQSFNASKMFMSQLRFCFNCVIFATIASFFVNSSLRTREKLISSYVYICTIASAFIIVQFLSFYLLRFNLAFDFGSYQGGLNHASLEVPSLGALYRTGGFFKEPSWYALFVGPVLDIAYKRGQIKELVVCVVGMVFSTSSMAFLFLMFFVYFDLKSNRKYLILFIVAAISLYFVFPMAFTRLLGALTFEEGADNSNNGRVILPFTLIWEYGNFPLLGLNISTLYDMQETLFLNTFLFVLTSFGIVGLCLFLKMIYQKDSPLLTFILISTVIIEGCYGRIDFWMALLATTIFTYSSNKQLNLHKINS